MMDGDCIKTLVTEKQPQKNNCSQAIITQSNYIHLESMLKDLQEPVQLNKVLQEEDMNL